MAENAAATVDRDVAQQKTEKATKKSIKIKPEMANAIEKRLSLPHGTLIVEIASDLANRFSDTGPNAIRRLHGERMELLEAVENENWDRIRKNNLEIKMNWQEVLNPANARKQILFEITKKEAEIKQDWQEEKAMYYKAVEAYLMKNYGERRHDEQRRIIGYGEEGRLQVDPVTMHLHKLW